MADVVVTVPMGRWDEWLCERDLAGDEWSGTEFDFYLGGPQPRIGGGERVYIVAHGRLRGFAPLIRVDDVGWQRWALVRGGGAVAVTIPETIVGFRGFKYRWWRREDERPFPNWRETPDAQRC